MDIGKSIGYVFEDQKWTSKLLLAVVVSIIPIVNFALAGYLIVIMRNVSERNPQPLPEWDNFGDKFLKGLILVVAGLIYFLPALILFCPLVFVPFFATSTSGEGQNAVRGLFAGTAFLLTCAFVIYGLVISFLFPAINLNYARKGTFGACFEFGEIWRIMSRNLGDYVVAWLIALVVAVAAGFVASMVALLVGWIPCLGWIAAWLITGLGSVWAATVYAHLFGQIGQQPPDQSLIPSGQA